MKKCSDTVTITLCDVVKFCTHAIIFKRNVD
jgi:hypothetical protein